MRKSDYPILILIIGLSSLLLVSCGFGQSRMMGGSGVYYYPGVGLGTVIAVVVSWSRNHSILWAIIHGIFGWFYVIYALLFRNSGH